MKYKDIPVYLDFFELRSVMGVVDTFLKEITSPKATPVRPQVQKMAIKLYHYLGARATYRQQKSLDAVECRFARKTRDFICSLLEKKLEELKESRISLFGDIAAGRGDEDILRPTLQSVSRYITSVSNLIVKFRRK